MGADALNEPVPPQIDEVLATVLREAVTNVLRHTEATVCGIVLSVDGGTVTFRVTNDGIAESVPVNGRKPERAAGGQGLRSLAARAAAQGGRLATETEGDRFELTVQVPLPTVG